MYLWHGPGGHMYPLAWSWTAIWHPGIDPGRPYGTLVSTQDGHLPGREVGNRMGSGTRVASIRALPLTMAGYGHPVYREVPCYVPGRPCI